MTLNEEWRTSSFSATDGACVQVCQVGDTIYVRDAKAGETGPVIVLTCAEWRAFEAGVKAGQFVAA